MVQLSQEAQEAAIAALQELHDKGVPLVVQANTSLPQAPQWVPLEPVQFTEEMAMLQRHPIQDPRKRTSLQMVEEFHRVFDYPWNEKPCIPGLDAGSRQELRVASNQLLVICLALKKYLEASVDKPSSVQRAALMIEELHEFIHAMANNDIREAFDALLDLRYVNDGSVGTLGLASVFDEGMRRLHASNMSKKPKDGPVVKDSRGKVVKGDWYTPLDIGDLIV